MEKAGSESEESEAASAVILALLIIASTDTALNAVILYVLVRFYAK